MVWGQTEMMQARGNVVFRVENEVSGKCEPHRLDEVHYSPNAHANLISLGYIHGVPPRQLRLLSSSSTLGVR
ncbi:hypothetical protein PC116_g24391 [Phytophthora cactorum]|uniref:Uncharacterized protein n=1 Tax=Phytophthora cactorum TaxID=29920 RepID=A0A8T1JV43_9STRA|nr:hypothetical protein PC117_g22071 [Phytophthora cactorum]KAG4227212.1 hypothetical protein PC116_g24391 [Phytophthora cactorum]